jgi:hypothetical protein
MSSTRRLCESASSPVRGISAYAMLARRADAVVERGTRAYVRLVLEALGDSWGLIATDVTRGRAGDNERLFLSSTHAGSAPLDSQASSSSPSRKKRM